jgi:hypothetical protein
MNTTTNIKETNKLERYAVMAFDGNEWGRLYGSMDSETVSYKSWDKFIEKKMKSVKINDTFEFEEDAIAFAKKSWKMMGNIFKEMKVVKVVEIETTTVTTVIDEDNGVVVKKSRKGK